MAGENLLRELAPQVLGAVVRRCGDFAAGEDAVQEALLAASRQWPVDGMPDNPRGWLIQVAVRRLTDYIRSESARRRREGASLLQEPFDREIVQSPDAPHVVERDDTLMLLFMCCHESLPRSAAIALTLRAVGGLSTAAIAHAFMVPEPTMAQRISRAKARIRSTGATFRVPDAAERASRLAAVRHVLYLIFNEGYSASSGTSLQRVDLSAEAIRLTRMLHRVVSDDAESAGLLALMLLTDARRPARTGMDGGLIPLSDQDRRLWDRQAIAEGTELLARTLAAGSVGPYQLQAAIAALHDEAPAFADTDWPQILALYELLLRMSDNAMVALNHAVALAMVHGAEAGLERLAAIEAGGELAASHRVDAVRAHLLERAGRCESAIAAYRAAAGRTASLPERDYLLGCAARLLSSAEPGAS